MALLQIDELAVSYGNVTALQGVSLALDRGGAVAILGRNGAGKSTLLNTIAGLVRPTGGHVRWDGENISRTPAPKRARKGISLVAEGKRIFSGLTVAENLRLGGFHVERGLLDEAVGRVEALFPILADRSRQLAGQLSGGQQQMLAIGRALMASPTLLLLDEPSMGLAPKIATEVYGRLAELRTTGITLVIVEQQVERVLGLVDDVVVLNLGRVVLSEHAAQLSRDDPRIRDAYMGTGAQR